MTALDIFTYSGQQVRTVLIDGEAWWVAADVAAILDLGNVHSSLALLDDDERALHSMESRQIAVVSESGLYSLILRSRKPEAKEFKRWITREVLPQIHRTGSYSKPVSLAERSLALIGDLTSEVTRQAAQLEEQAPLVAQALTYQDAGNLTTRAVFAREIIKWALAEGYTVKQPEVLAFLSIKLGLFVRGARADNGEATLDAQRRGLATTVKGTALNGHNYATGKLTTEGVAYAWARITRHINETGALELAQLAVAS